MKTFSFLKQVGIRLIVLCCATASIQATNVTVYVPAAGQLQTALSTVLPSTDVDSLTITGFLNSSDFDYMKDNLSPLSYLDLWDVTVTNNAIPSDALSNKTTLKEVILPSSVVSVGNYAFNSCDSLSVVKMPDGLQTIGFSAFGYCDLMGELILPEALISIGVNAFYNNQIEGVVLPKGLLSIGNNAFLGNLITGVIFPEGLQSIGSRAFYNCPLDSITLPATLTSIGDYALNSATIKKITCLQPVPPSLNSDPFSSVNKTTCELVVPFWAETNYKLANIWSQFKNVSTWNEEIDYLPVSGSISLNERPLGNPTVEIMSNGSLNIREVEIFNTADFILRHQLSTAVLVNTSTTTYSHSSYYSQLISEHNTLNTQNAKIDMSVNGNRWYYLSFPFDVAMSDISIDDGASYVFRYYDGASRAEAGAGSSWKNVGQNDTLRSGTGYIFQCNRNVNNLVLPATSESKNRLSASTPSIVLNEYPAEDAANRSWNLVGNPFPSCYDISYMNYTAPVTYWNDNYNRYEAVSPVDDAFVLKPMQAFFVQKTTDLETITFDPEGRQTSFTAQLRSSALRSTSSYRTLINLTLSDENTSDKSRIVLNPDAQLAYEIECDAAKFMSTVPEVPQLYSIDLSNVYYAINERPVADGIIPLGIYTGVAGSFNITLESPVSGFEILLKDKVSGNTVDLSFEEYTFFTETGTFDNRFEIHIKEAENAATGNLETENSQVNVYAAKGAIVVENATGVAVVYSANGIRTAMIDAQQGTQHTIPVPQGVYVVKLNGKAYKTVVF